MEPQVILYLLVVMSLVGVFVSRPFWRAIRSSQTDDYSRSFLLAERERLLTTLQELDFDHSLGKIPEEDYPIQRAELLRQGAEVMESLERQVDANADAPIPMPEKTPRHVDDDYIEDLIAKRRSARKEQTDGFCPNCGKAVLPSDSFCPGCGTSLK